MYRVLYLIMIFAMVACKNDGSTTNEKAGAAGTTQLEEERYVAPPRDNVPIAADLISKEQMADFLEIDVERIYEVIRNVNDENSNDNSVFFRVEDPDLGNSAVMIQVTSNPLPDEISDYEFASYYINNKINEGERSMKDPEDPIRFKEWDMGVSGAYNKNLGKYYWRDKENFIYMFATNVTLPIELQFKAAEKLANTITPKE